MQTVRNQHVWTAAVFCEAACSLEASAEEAERYRSSGCEGQLAGHSARSALSCSCAIAWLVKYDFCLLPGVERAMHEHLTEALVPRDADT